MTKTARFLPISLLMLGALLLLAGMLAVSGTNVSVQNEAGAAKYTQMTNFKASGTSNGRSPCGAGKSAPPPYRGRGSKSDQCRPTSTP